VSQVSVNDNACILLFVHAGTSTFGYGEALAKMVSSNVEDCQQEMMHLKKKKKRILRIVKGEEANNNLE